MLQPGAVKRWPCRRQYCSHLKDVYKRQELYRATVAAGEQSGHLEVVFERLADYTEARQQMRQKVGLALFYPLMLTGVAILVVAGLLTYVVPQVVQVFGSLNQQLPALTRGLIALSEFLRQNGWWLLAILAGGVIAWVLALRRIGFRRRVDQALLLSLIHI